MSIRQLVRKSIAHHNATMAKYVAHWLNGTLIYSSLCDPPRRSAFSKYKSIDLDKARESINIHLFSFHLSTDRFPSNPTHW